MSLRIDHLCLHLPPRCAGWRPLIERRLERELADLAPRQSLAMARLDLGRLALPAQAGPDELARLIAERLRECLARQLAMPDDGLASAPDPATHSRGLP